MSHPFGDLLHQHLHRRHGLTQSKLAEGVLQDPAVISNMCHGRRRVGQQARERIVAIIGWLRQQDVLTTQEEADALLRAGGLIGLQSDVPDEAQLLAMLAPAVPDGDSALAREPDAPRPVDDGNIEQAVELHEFVCLSPARKYHRFLFEVAGERIMTAADNLPSDDVEAARSRARNSSLKTAAEALLHELADLGWGNANPMGPLDPQ